MKNQSKLKIAYGIVVVLILCYAVAVLVYLGVKRGARAVTSNLFGLACICAAFVCITIFSYFLTKNARSGKRKTEGKSSDSDAGEQTERSTGKVRTDMILIPLVCFAIAAVLIAWAVTGFGISAGLKSVLGDGYVKTRATIVQSVSASGDTEKLVYEYVVADGQVYRSVSGTSFGGIVFETGRQVTVYYQVENPGIAVNLSTPVILLSGALLFLTGGIGWFLSGFSQKRKNAAGYLVFTFFALFGMMFYLAGWLASGLNVLELCMSGATYYAITIFMLAGFFLDILGFVGLVRRRKNKKEHDKDEG